MSWFLAREEITNLCNRFLDRDIDIFDFLYSVRSLKEPKSGIKFNYTKADRIEQILNYMRKNPNKWHTNHEISCYIGISKEMISRYTKDLHHKNRVEKTALKNGCKPKIAYRFKKV